MKEIELQIPKGKPRIALVASRFNQFITDELLAGARDALSRNHVDEDRVL